MTRLIAGLLTVAAKEAYMSGLHHYGVGVTDFVLAYNRLFDIAFSDIYDY